MISSARCGSGDKCIFARRGQGLKERECGDEIYALRRACLKINAAAATKFYISNRRQALVLDEA